MSPQQLPVAHRHLKSSQPLSTKVARILVRHLATILECLPAQSSNQPVIEVEIHC
ncbi:hypothetical protein Mal48_00590 [Thalassoglobus polymorphus]|uniref:Uncharacterized protein n=1 Tax=Thalassoglobus polymorphus TaxID=2527994 RepID=A0A517QGT1_9PLAN|nr:hypothetical protein Mal48_00590 [Thalassoglobus polymorphus]